MLVPAAFLVPAVWAPVAVLLLVALYCWLVWELIHAPLCDNDSLADPSNSSQWRPEPRKRRKDAESESELKFSDATLPWPHNRSSAHFHDDNHLCHP
jgi:hypothetical protein